MIPKIIHYCWLSDDPMPKESIDYINCWRSILPDYKFILWNRDFFDVDSVPWVKEAFSQKKYAFAADYIRLFAVYNYGGFYLDTDVELKKSFDDLLDENLIIAYENRQKNGIEAGCFGAEKGNSFVGKCLSHYEGRHFINTDGSFDTKTLPVIMAESVFPEMKENIFTCDFFTAKNQESGIIEETSNTYTIHHFAGSWLNDFEKSILKISKFCYSKYGCGLKGKFLLSLLIVRNRFKYEGTLKSIRYYMKQYFVPRNAANTIKSLWNFFRKQNG